MWSSLHSEGISDDGGWVQYTLGYPNSNDTLFVKNSKATKIFAFLKGSKGTFLGDRWFGCMLPENRFRLTALSTSAVQDYAGVDDFIFSSNGSYLLLFRRNESGALVLEIRNLKGLLVKSIAAITSYTLSPDGASIAYCTSQDGIGAVGLLHLGKSISTTAIVAAPERIYDNVVWHHLGTSVTFVSRAAPAPAMTADALLFFKLQTKKLYRYDTTTAKDWSTDYKLASNYVSSLGISDTEDSVFFGIQKITIPQKELEDAVQVWNAADKELLSWRQEYESTENGLRYAMWIPEQEKIVFVSTDVHPDIQLTGDQKHALVYHSDTLKPTFKECADRDYYLLDLDTGKESLFLASQSGAAGNVFFSPDGKYILYFRAEHWWFYSITSKKHQAITDASAVNFSNDVNKQSFPPDNYGVPEWTAGDTSVYLYDAFDVWEYTFALGTLRRLTRGREHQIVYRIVSTKAGNSGAVVYKKTTFGNQAPLLLSGVAENFSSYGYYLLAKNGTLQTLVHLPKRIFGFKKAKNDASYLYQVEDFNVPTSLCIQKGVTSATTVFQSNLQHYHYGWGKSELIDYTNSKGESLQGILYYPFDYDPTKKYPMVVSIYEKQIGEFHRYVAPSMLNGSSFNISVFTSNGYFVLLPDIVYEYGRPGFSATECVVAATLKAVSVASIDSSKIGLNGHSFGGFETSFIITQTNIFAAALASAGIHDMISHSLTEDAPHKSNNWRFEHQQLRMKRSLYEDYAGYVANSPIYYSANVTTPLLTYTGSDDVQVNAKQTYELYFALRRLQKEHIMLIYPDEEHILFQPKHQYDITQKMLEWFGHYLKGYPKPDWFAVH
ncbi:prolyl oligopeptidase family serine peptidase [Flavobacterium sp.]